jgi:DNA-binding NarL/FixJ family response regulator
MLGHRVLIVDDHAGFRAAAAAMLEAAGWRYSVTGCGSTPRPVIAAAPQRAPKSTAS